MRKFVIMKTFVLTVLSKLECKNSKTEMKYTMAAAVFENDLTAMPTCSCAFMMLSNTVVESVCVYMALLSCQMARKPKMIA